MAKTTNGLDEVGLARVDRSGLTFTAEIGESRYGTLQPRVLVSATRGTSPRRISPVLHLIAAAVETATAGSERWAVQVSMQSDELGWVWLDLMEGDDAEAERGLALLRAIVAKLNAEIPR